MNKILTAFIVIICLSMTISFASAEEYIYEQNNPVDLKISCFDIYNSYCNAVTECNITIFYPNASVLINNQLMTYNITHSYYSLNENQTLILGEHSAVVQCSGTTNGYTTFFYEIIPLSRLTTRDCSEETSWVWVFLFIGIILITMAMAFKIGVLGFFGSLAWLITSWTIVLCQGLIGYILAIVSLFLMLWFVLRKPPGIGSAPLS